MWRDGIRVRSHSTVSYPIERVTFTDEGAGLTVVTKTLRPLQAQATPPADAPAMANRYTAPHPAFEPGRMLNNVELDDSELIDSARSVIDIERAALEALGQRLDSRFAQACRVLFATRGRVVVLGMGKSGHVGSKIAATLASTGTPAFFVHPGEAGHGDLGMITAQDTVLALSNSGETHEILTILPMLKRQGVDVVAISGNADSTLATDATVWLDASVDKEACPHNLAPTSSTTVALAIGDALAVALLQARGFSEEDFARSHPGGALGKRLLLYVADVMHTGADVPQIAVGATLQQALVEMSGKGLGMTAVVADDGTLAGVFTDGDLRRALANNIDIYSSSIADVMTTDPVVTTADVLASEVVHLMRENSISGVFVVDQEQQIAGALNHQTLLRAGII